MKHQRGFGLIEVLVFLAIFMLVLAMVGQNLVSVMQSSHETQVQQGISDVMVAESSYKSLYGVYATGVNSPRLSTCPASGAPTSTQACLLSAAFTSGGKYNSYTFAISTPADAGYLVTAVPANTSAGRLSYCGSNDGLVHGKVAKVPPTMTTAAQCDALPALVQGASAPPGMTAYSTSGSGTVAAGGVGTLATLTLPAGSYALSAPLSYTLSRSPTASATNTSIVCALAQGATVIQQQTFNPSGQPVYDRTTFSSVASLASSGTVTLACANHEDAGAGIINTMTYNVGLVATPVSQIVSQ
jgi:type II secretory pathway pseudopilin PulG